MAIRVQDLEFNLQTIAKSDIVRVLDVIPLYKFEGEKRSDVQSGWIYQCLEEISYNKFAVKVQDLTPAISPEALKAAEGPVYLSFVCFSAKFFYSRRTNNFELTASAMLAEAVPTGKK